MHHSHRIAVLAAGFIAGILQTFAALEPVEFVGCMTYALSWDGRNPKYGFYSFNSDGSHPFMPVSQIATANPSPMPAVLTARAATSATM